MKGFQWIVLAGVVLSSVSPGSESEAAVRNMVNNGGFTSDSVSEGESLSISGTESTPITSLEYWTYRTKEQTAAAEAFIWSLNRAGASVGSFSVNREGTSSSSVESNPDDNTTVYLFNGNSVFSTGTGLLAGHVGGAVADSAMSQSINITVSGWYSLSYDLSRVYYAGNNGGTDGSGTGQGSEGVSDDEPLPVGGGSVGSVMAPTNAGLSSSKSDYVDFSLDGAWSQVYLMSSDGRSVLMGDTEHRAVGTVLTGASGNPLEFATVKTDFVWLDAGSSYELYVKLGVGETEGNNSLFALSNVTLGVPEPGMVVMASGMATGSLLWQMRNRVKRRREG